MESKTSATHRSGPGPLAIATFVLACVGLATGGLTSVIALVTGTIELFNIRAGRSSRAGYGLNLVGFAIAVLTISIGIAFGYLFISYMRPIAQMVTNMVQNMVPRGPTK